MRDPRDDWRAYDPDSIPTKDSTPQLDRFLDALADDPARSRPRTLIDVGCGNGRLALRLAAKGFAVTGVDVSPAAIAAARSHAATAGLLHEPRFEVADVAADRPPHVAGGPFDVAVCQLVLSIIGGVRDRERLLRHVHGLLRPGGSCYLSASGVSDSINPGYARLYAADLPLTGERHSYLSRDARGTALYTTHHFTADELAALLNAVGFTAIDIVTEREASSRRPEEAAYFHYATCRRAPA